MDGSRRERLWIRESVARDRAEFGCEPRVVVGDDPLAKGVGQSFGCFDVAVKPQPCGKQNGQGLFSTHPWGAGCRRPLVAQLWFAEGATTVLAPVQLFVSPAGLPKNS